MSSEQRYDYSYAQFVQDDLPGPGLFGGDLNVPSITGAPTYNFQENYPTIPPQEVQPFYGDFAAYEQTQPLGITHTTAGNGELTLFPTPQPSGFNAFAIPEVVEENERLGFDAGSFNWDEELQTWGASVDHSLAGTFQGAPQLVWNSGTIHPTDFSTNNNNIAQMTPPALQPLEPLEVSFFFRNMLTRRRCLFP